VHSCGLYEKEPHVGDIGKHFGQNKTLSMVKEKIFGYVDKYVCSYRSC
jgi:hypothetical protein